MSTTFKLCDVEIPETPLPQLPYRFVLENQLNSNLEGYPFSVPFLVDKAHTAGALEEFSKSSRSSAIASLFYSLITERLHPFVDAIHFAFAHHYPLSLSPDHIWLVLCQGFANHVRLNAAQLREKFVLHTGKVNLIVRRNNFIKGNLDNDWEGAITEFVDQMRNHIGDTADLITARFSTTTPVEQTAFNIALMDAMQHYFDYTLSTRCGIPAITLEGTPEDWQALFRSLHSI